MIVEIRITVCKDDDEIIGEKMLKVQSDSAAMRVFNWAQMVQEVINELIKQLIGTQPEL